MFALKRRQVTNLLQPEAGTYGNFSIGWETRSERPRNIIQRRLRTMVQPSGGCFHLFLAKWCIPSFSLEIVVRRPFNEQSSILAHSPLLKGFPDALSGVIVSAYDEGCIALSMAHLVRVGMEGAVVARGLNIFAATVSIHLDHLLVATFGLRNGGGEAFEPFSRAPPRAILSSR